MVTQHRAIRLSNPHDATRLRRRALWLEVATACWNLLEGIVAVAAGMAAGSVALIGFGVDSFVEVSSAVVRWLALS